MDRTLYLKEIFNKALNGIYEIPNDLPSDISRDVVEKNLLYVELQNLLKENTNKIRINEIKEILYPIEEEVEDGESI